MIRVGKNYKDKKQISTRFLKNFFENFYKNLVEKFLFMRFLFFAAKNSFENIAEHLERIQNRKFTFTQFCFALWTILRRQT